MDGSIHEPKFLKIEWGTLIFKCRLKSVNISYTLFDKAGKPLRAELDTTFVSDLKDSERVKAENKTSPDLTHKRIVRAHDTLPLMCKEIYGTEGYYLQVARANKLDNFRNLQLGQELFFPPVEK
jgi:nucleoid-associated protein YgaU